MNSLASSSASQNEESPNICECCACLTFEEKNWVESQLEIYSSLEDNYRECLCEGEVTQKYSSTTLGEIECSIPLSIKEKVQLVLQQVDSEIGLKILRWITIDEATLEEDLNEIASIYEKAENEREYARSNLEN